MDLIGWKGNRMQGSPPYGMARRRFNMALIGSGLALCAIPVAAIATATTPPSTAEGSGKTAETSKVIRLMALGDSLTAGYGLPPADGFTARLQAALDAAAGTNGRKVEVLNAGVSGDTSAGGLARLDWALADRPDAAIVELGANDMLRGLSPEAARDNLDQILARLKQENVPVLFAGMRASPSLGADYVRRFDAIYPDLAERHGVDLYPFFLDGVAADRRLNQPDGLHPNAEGVAIIVERILPNVLKLLDQFND